MGTVIPFVGYYSYKLISGNSAMTSNLRIAAAAVAGWIGLSVASGVAGFEMGMQPILEHAADGTPLYMPYGLNVTMPAMLLDHMLFFSIVEAVVTGLAFAYIAKNSPEVIFDYNSGDEKKSGVTPGTAPV